MASSSVKESSSSHPLPSAEGQHSADSATTSLVTVAFSGSMLYVAPAPTVSRNAVPSSGSDAYRRMRTHAGLVALYPSLFAARATSYPEALTASDAGAPVRFLSVRTVASVALIEMLMPPASSAGSNTSNETYDGFVASAFSTGNSPVAARRSR